MPQITQLNANKVKLDEKNKLGLYNEIIPIYSKLNGVFTHFSWIPRFTKYCQYV